MKELYELKGEGHSIRGIARELGISRNSVRKYLKSPGVPQAKPRPRRSSKLDPYAAYVDHRLSDGLENCVVLLRELRARGYEGGYTTLVEYVRPRRRRRQPKATVRFETAPGEQAQVDWGSFAYVAADGRRQRMWAFVMVLGWVARHLRRVRAAGGRVHLHGLPHQRLRVLWRSAPAVSLRQRQGGGAGPGRRRSSRVEPQDAGPVAADGF